jgi:hypothetical protein
MAERPARPPAIDTAFLVNDRPAQAPCPGEDDEALPRGQARGAHREGAGIGRGSVYRVIEGARATELTPACQS